MSETVVIPGDVVELPITQRPQCSQIHDVVGPGLTLGTESGAKIVATKAGVLRHLRARQSTKAQNAYFVDCGGRRYTPTDGDYVLGVVTGKTSETFKIDIGTAEHVMISALSFQGATKRMKPDVAIGDVILCKLIVPNKDIEPDGICVNDDGLSHGLGVIARTQHSTMVNVPLHTCLALRLPDSPLRVSIMRAFKCELIVGVNGRIVVNAACHRDVVAICDALFSLSACTNQMETDCVFLAAQTFAQKI